MVTRVCVCRFWNVLAVGRKVLYVILGIREVFRAQVISYFTKFEHQDFDTSLVYHLTKIPTRYADTSALDPLWASIKVDCQIR